jgi:Domain of unknown function (DUF4184)
MPIPLAHPAAVLPLRRWCPKYFDFSALVVGSLVPDLAAGIDDLEYFSHSILGSLLFCLPVGYLTLWILHRVRSSLVATLPNPHRDVLLSFRNSTSHCPIQLISLLLGSWLHIAWDMFTHDYSWLVRRTVLSSVMVDGLPLNHIVWFVSSILGSAIMLVMYVALIRKRERPTTIIKRSESWSYTLWIAMLLLPLAVALAVSLYDPDYSSGTFVRYLAMRYYLFCYITLSLAGFVIKYLRRHVPVNQCTGSSQVPESRSG